MKIEIKLPFNINIEDIFFKWFYSLREEREDAIKQGNSTELIPDVRVIEDYDEETNEVRAVYYEYVTCSKKGTWKLDVDFEKKEMTLTFEGYRNSFLGGNLFMEVTEIPLYPEPGNKVKLLLMDTEGNEHIFEGKIISYETSRPDKPLGFSQKLWAAIRRFSQEHPRLFSANSKFFKYVLENDDKIEEQLIKWFSEHPKSEVYIIATKNKLSKWTELVIKVYRNHQKSYSSEAISIFKAYKYTKNYMDNQVYFIDQDEILERPIYSYYYVGDTRYGKYQCPICNKVLLIQQEAGTSKMLQGVSSCNHFELKIIGNAEKIPEGYKVLTEFPYKIAIYKPIPTIIIF